MDVLKWVYIWNDPLGEARVSIVLTCVAFLFLCFVVFRLAKWLAMRSFAGPMLDSLALMSGWKDFHELFMEWVRLCTWFATIFLAGVMLYYFFTQGADLKASYGSASVVLTYQNCIDTGGYMACEKRTPGQPLFSNWSGNTDVIIISHNQT
jgi:hypothetical protein